MARAEAERPAAIAPAWHTVGFVLLFPALGIWQLFHFQTFQVHNRAALYGSSIAIEWISFCYVWLLGLRPRGVRVRDVVGGRWARFQDVATDVGVAFVFWLIVVGALLALRSGLGANPDELRAMKILAPQNAAEAIVWIGLSVTAGFCEEFMFRGYLQKQLFAWTGSASAAAVLQAIVFGFGHSYQGWKGVITISVYGMLFGALATVRKSLRPGMIQHATQDSITGVAVWLLTRDGYGKLLG
jgi:uncharacterized protein